MHSDQLNCREMFERLSEYIDGELDAKLCECFDEHLQDCEPCLAFIATLRKTVELCRESGPDAPAQSLFSPEEIAAFKAAYEQAARDLSHQRENQR
jgi:anti-sigma factor RsiW